ncbi:hypothetical protein AB0E73_32745, partial [Streptomyces sp. NPDC031705]
MWVQPAQPVGTGLGFPGAGVGPVPEGEGVPGFFEGVAEGFAEGPETEGEGPGVGGPGCPPATGEPPAGAGVGAAVGAVPSPPEVRAYVTP